MRRVGDADVGVLERTDTGACVVVAHGVALERTYTGACVEGTLGVVNERERSVRRVGRADGVASECIETNGRVVVDGVGKERVSADGRVRAAGDVVR